MFVAVRRGPASIAKCLRLPSTSSTSSNLALSWKNGYFVTRLASTPALRAFNTAPPWRQEAAVRAPQYNQNGDAAEEESEPKSPRAKAEYGPVTKFAELGERNMVCQTVVDTITRGMKLDTMTHVQSLTINETLKGIDVLAQARTGTGKTLAFLIPLLQNIISVDPMLEHAQPVNRDRRSPQVDIRAIIISPTRELAEQIAVEARKVANGTGVIVQTAVGGTMKREGMRRIRTRGCHILVGTPGRLEDILSDPHSGISAPNLSAFVLDEADRLLDQGFSEAIEDIQKHLPNRSDRDRQTLLFSATVPAEVMRMVRRTMKPDFKIVRTVQQGEQETHMKVPQKLAFVGGFENIMPALVELCKREQQKSSDQPFKAIVYFGATAEVALAASTFAKLQRSGDYSLGKNLFFPASIIEMHGKLSQAERTRAAETFRQSKSGILLSSDVTARGMDFPNVTHVIQVGIPQTRESYVHRIGRTARGDKEGEGWLLLTDLEKSEARGRLRGLPLVLDTSLETARIDMSKDAQLTASAAETLTQTINASKLVPERLKEAAYVAILGLYNWVSAKAGVVESLNARAKYCWAMDSPPRVSAGVVQRLGLRGLPGIEIGGSRSYETDGDSNSRYGRGDFQNPRGGRDGGSWTQRGRTGGSNFRDRDSSGGDGAYGGGARRPFGDRGSFGNRGGDRGSFGTRGGDRDSFGNRGGDRSSFGNRGGDRGSFGNRGGDRGSFGNRGGDRGSFGNRGGGRGSFGNRGGDRGSQGQRGGGGDGGGKRESDEW